MKNILLCIARFLDLAPSEDEKKMVESREIDILPALKDGVLRRGWIKNSYSSLKVSNRGVVSVLADEVINNPEFQELYPKVSKIVKKSNEIN